MIEKDFVLNFDTGEGYIVFQEGEGMAITTIKIKDNGTVTKGWTKYKVAIKNLREMQEKIRYIDIERVLQNYPDYWAYTKMCVEL